jgi:hypothetical protein
MGNNWNRTLKMSDLRLINLEISKGVFCIFPVKSFLQRLAFNLILFYLLGRWIPLIAAVLLEEL